MRGKSWFYSCAVSLLAIFEFDDGYAFYCVMLSLRPREPVTALKDFVSASALATLAGSTEPARLIASAKSLMPS